MKTQKTPWVVMGGSEGEIGHCTRCGDGLSINLPQPIPIVVAASRAFVKIHARCRDTGRTEPTPHNPGAWLRGRDTGISSMTIYGAITGQPMTCDPDIPYDPSDFGRCYRLLKLFPHWRSQLPQVAAKHPRWIPFIDNWDRLTEMYERVIAGPEPDPWKLEESMKMWELMKELRK